MMHSPAYDITYIIDSGGYQPNVDHCLYIRAKLRGITRDDVIEFAHDNGIRRPDAIIRDVVGSLRNCRAAATKYGVSEQWIGRVETTIASHLKAWDLWEEGTLSSAIQVEGHTVTDFHIELQYKGNFLLLATIDGRDMKYIIRKGTQEYDDIAKTGLASMTDEKKKELISLYLLPKIEGEK